MKFRKFPVNDWKSYVENRIFVNFHKRGLQVISIDIFRITTSKKIVPVYAYSNKDGKDKREKVKLFYSIISYVGVTDKFLEQ